MSEAKLKVWGTGMLSVRQAAPAPNGNRQVRVIAAVGSAAAFARLVGESLYFVRNYASETHNDGEIKQAMSEPGALFYFDAEGDKRWHRYQRVPNLARAAAGGAGAGKANE